ATRIGFASRRSRDGTSETDRSTSADAPSGADGETDASRSASSAMRSDRPAGFRGASDGRARTPDRARAPDPFPAADPPDRGVVTTRFFDFTPSPPADLAPTSARR